MSVVCGWAVFVAHASCPGTLHSQPSACLWLGAAGMIGKHLELKRGGNGRYQKTAAYGHFGRDDADFTWETVLKLE